MRAIRNTPWSASAVAVITVLFVGSVLPVWIVWRLVPEGHCAVGELGTLWQALFWLPQHLRIAGNEHAWNLHLWNVVGLSILSSLSAAVGASVYVSKRRRLAKLGD